MPVSKIVWTCLPRTQITGDQESIEIAQISGLILPDRNVEPANTCRRNHFQLKPKVHKIGLLSNCSSETIIVWDETPFTGILISRFFLRGRVMKPDPRIYHIALEKLKVNPVNVFILRTAMDGELKAAAAVGMTPVRISSRTQTKMTLIWKTGTAPR